jgi:uroporphyrinogen III methyltransferase/synthase
MGMKSLPRIVAALVAGGMPADTPAAAVQWGTHPHQRTVTGTVSTLAAVIEHERMSAPVITIIGPVVALRDEIRWFDRRPLFGKRIVVTRARFQAAALSDRLAAMGAEVLEMPATRIEAVDRAPLRNAIARLSTFGWIIFTSQNAVRLFWNAIRTAGLDARALAGAQIAAVGPATADALLECGLAVDVTPDRFVAEALIDAMRDRRDVRGARVLYVAAEGARPALEEGLAGLGALVERVVLYKSVVDGAGAQALRERLAAGDADLVTFTSASSVTAFVAAVGADAARRCAAASIGPITTAAAREHGVSVVIEASDSTIPGLVESICQYFATARRGAP